MREARIDAGETVIVFPEAGCGNGGNSDAADDADADARRRRSFVRCHSTGPFEMPPSELLTSDERRVVEGDAPGVTVVNPPLLPRASDPSMMGSEARGRVTAPRKLSAKEVNGTLNLNLGLPVDLTKSAKLRAAIRWISDFFQLFEVALFRLWDRLPLRFRQKLTMLAWKVYYPVHKYLLGRRTGIHPDASHEYHALTTVMWWGRLFPVTVRRMRFSLSQLGVWHPPEAYPPCLKRSAGDKGGDGGDSSSSTSRVGEDTGEGTCADGGGTLALDPSEATVVARIRHDMGPPSSRRLARGILTRSEAEDGDDSVVTGLYVRHGPRPSTKVVFWLYGGAYLAGDSLGNVGIAEKIGQRCGGADVFLPDYRLLPEHEFYDALHDVVLAYEYLIDVRGAKPEDVVLLGVSSGGGLVARLLQTITEKREEAMAGRPGGEVTKDALFRNPAGGVLMCPFVDYTEPKGSFKEYVAHDLIVNQAVFEEGIPYLASLGSAENRMRQSPAHRSFRGLPPLAVVVSEHECCYDQTVLLVNRARKDGVEVTLGVWRYMCHVFPMLSMFLPEGREAIDFMVDWMKRRLA